MSRWSLLVRSGLLTLVVAVGLAAGCAQPGGSGSPVPAGSSPAAAAKVFPITIGRTGGFAGVRESVTIGADGGWTYTPKSGTSTGGTLSPADLAQLVQAVSDPAFLTELRPDQAAGTCSDAFTYSVSLGGETMTFTDCGPATARPLFAQVTKLLADRTPF